MARHLDLGARVRRSFLAVSLVAGTMAAVAVTPQTATAAVTDQLVVVDVRNNSSHDLAKVSLRTINANGDASSVNPVNLPSANGGGQNAFTLDGGSDGNGELSLSDDKTYLTLAGYNRAPGAISFTHTVKGVSGIATPVTAAINEPKDTYSSEINRMVAKISATGGNASIDTTTLLTGNTLSSSAPRQALGINGSLYVTGNGNAETGDSTYNGTTWTSQPKNTTDGGVVKVDLGGANKVTIGCPGTAAPCAAVTGPPPSGGKQTNTRKVQVGTDGLYMTSEKAAVRGFGKFGGSSVPTAITPITQKVAIADSSDLPEPDSFAMVDANPAVTGIDTAYVVINKPTREIRKYTADSAGSWSAAGSLTGDYVFLTARVADGGNVEVFATKGTAAANTVVKLTDTNPTGSAALAEAPTPIATALSGHSFRGLAFAPTGWDPGTASTTISADEDSVGATLGDTHNPTTKLTLADNDTPLDELTVTASSSNTTVIPNAGVALSGTGATRTATFTPSTVGRSTITFTVDDGDGHTATQEVEYGASAAPSSSSGRYLYGSSDLSSAVDVGDDHVIAVSSEDNKIRLYKKAESNQPVKEFDFAADIGATNADLESMARANDTLYVLGSHGNSSSDGDLKPARDVMFTAAIEGSGADTTLTFVAKRTGLRDAIKAWDESHGNALGIAAGQAAGKKANDPDGFNIEGFELAAGSTTTGYLGFRSPVKDGKAVLVPVQGLGAMLTGTPTFGDPVFLDLGGRTVREIRKNGDDEYLISAHAGAASPEWKLFAWDGNPDHQAVDVSNLPAPDANRTGAWESIVSVPHPLTDGGAATLITDSGDTTFYGDLTAGADESKGLRKSYVDEVTTNSFTEYPSVPTFSPPSDLSSPSKSESSVSLAWTKVADATGYILSQRIGAGTPTTKQVGDVSATSFTGLTPSTEYTFDITAVKPDGTQSAASSPLTVTTAAVPTDRPSSVRWTSRTSTSMKIAWTKKSGSAKYKIRYFPEGDKTYKYLTVGNVSSANITGLSRGKAYVFKVAAISSNGTLSPYSSSLYASTSNLRPPTNFVKTSRTSTTITLSWTKATGANGYRIYRGVGSGTRTKIEVSGGDTQTVKLTGLKAGTTYTIDIASLEGSGNSRSSYTPRISVKTSG